MSMELDYSADRLMQSQPDVAKPISEGNDETTYSGRATQEVFSANKRLLF